MVTSSTKTVVAFAAEQVVLSCVATAANTVDIKWRKKAAGYTEQNQNYDTLTASQDNYDPSTNTRKSTLTLTSPTAADTSDSIECYDETIGISGVMALEVIGMIFSSIAQCSFPILIYETISPVVRKKCHLSVST